MRRSGPFKSMRFAAYRHFEKVEKVTGKVSLSHHLLEFVICKPVSDTSLASLVRETHPEGAGESGLSPSPSEGGIYSFLRSRRNSRKCDSFGRGRTGYCAFYVFWMVFIAVTPLEGVTADAVKDYSFRRSVAEKDVPQRQQIAENGAVVERDCRGNAAQKACSKGEAEIGDPQRQRIAEFGAVVERDSRGNAAQKACSKGAAEIGDPQRQRIAEFAAVAVPGKDSRLSGIF